MPLRKRQGRRRAVNNEQQPLQDITESFDRQAVYPSSLPPSSPIPGSTPSRVVSSEAGDLALDHDDDNDDNAENIPILPFKLGDHSIDVEPENPFVDSAFSPQPTDIEPDEPEDVDMTLSDPFGFVAVERKLKAQRAKLPQPKPIPERVEEPEPTRRSTSPIQIDTPSSTSGKHTIHVSEDEHGDVESLASPSPQKKRREEVKRKQREPQDPKKLADELRARLPPRRAAKRAREADPESTDEEPPRRSTRSSKRRKEEVPTSPPPLPPKRTRKKGVPSEKKKENAGTPARRSTRKAEKIAEEEEDCGDSEDDQEAQARQRQERIDYFKKLDGYKLHQENVYVV